MARPVDPQCRTFNLAIELLARPWTALILNALQPGPLRFSQIGAQVKGVGDKVLSARLKELEVHGLVIRRVEPGPPVRVGYELTQPGRAFGEVAAAVERWGRQLVPADEAESRPRRRSG